MISIVVYGRNDSYGYNLHRRAALSLNAMAEVLSDDGDEILFADFNTPNDMPTFPEAISDTLTPRAKAKLRIFRIRPAIAETLRHGSRLKAIEPAARNIAVRRMRPSNRWVLATNPDMIFVPRVAGQSLSDAARRLADGFYELPRFEIPEPLWESLDRMDPSSAIHKLAKWGTRLHLNEIVARHPAYLYDAPGDFQLILKDQLFAIDGFHEQMVHGWHVDINIAKRLWILNGETSSFSDHFFGYHCDHTVHAGSMHASGTSENKYKRFFYDVTQAEIPEQRESWGLPEQEIEEIRLDSGTDEFASSLESILPGMRSDTVTTILDKGTANHRVLYRSDHAIPYLAVHLSSLPLESTIGYIGNNVALVDLAVRFLLERGFKGRILAAGNMLQFSDGKEALHPLVEVEPVSTLEKEADLFLFDAGMQHFDLKTSDPGFPFSSPIACAWRATLVRTLADVAWAEYQRVRVKYGQPRKFLFLAGMETWFQSPSQYLIGTVKVPFAAHVRHGFIRPVPRFFKAERRSKGGDVLRHRALAISRELRCRFRRRFLADD